MSFSIYCPLVINQYSTEKELRIIFLKIKTNRFMTRDDFMNTISWREDDEHFE